MRNATDIILLSILNDPTRLSDLQQIIRGCSTQEAKAAALRGYCGKSLSNCLTVEREVVDNLMDRASWGDLADKLEAALQSERSAARVVASPFMMFGQS